jgi:hypothetical protein
MRENAHITIAVTPQEWLTLLEALDREKERRLTPRRNANGEINANTTLASRRRHMDGQRNYVREHIEPLRKYIHDALLED